MHLYAKYHLLIQQHKTRPSHLSTCPCHNSPHATSASDIHQLHQASKQPSFRQRRSKRGWHYGGLQRIGWKIGWRNGLSKTRISARSGLLMCYKRCGMTRKNDILRTYRGNFIPTHLPLSPLPPFLWFFAALEEA